MKYVLKNFQGEAVEDTLYELRNASRESNRRPQAVSLSAPTGSGKTVVAAAVIEALLLGDEAGPPDDEATFLWLSDLPELNEQTRRKLMKSSDLLGPERLRVIDSAFDDEAFLPGCVYFLNTQKLGRDRTLVSQGDRRTYTIWDTVKNTIRARGEHLYLIIDEAHRGMSQTSDETVSAETIVQRFVKGWESYMPAVPIILGISATPERFQRLIQGTNRVLRPIDVDVEKVRESGLLKDTLVLYHPTAPQAGDFTLLRAAALRFREYSLAWSKYCSTRSIEPVKPLLLVQVKDGTAATLTETDLAGAIDMLLDVLDLPDTHCMAHAFQEGTSLRVADHDLKYVAPSSIDESQDTTIVFFKTSLSTGWDCPRAEVMMSFRPVADATLIAQLVGRMVRTPLVRRIEAEELLNTVSLYLPHYDQAGLNLIMSKLRGGDTAVAVGNIEMGEDVQTLTRAASSEQAFALLESLPSSVIPRRPGANQVRRLMRLSRLLVNDHLDASAIDASKALLLAALEGERGRLLGQPEFEATLRNGSVLQVAQQSWGMLGELQDSHLGEYKVSDVDISAFFEYAGRRLAEGLNKQYWRNRVAAGVNSNDAKLELIALASDPTVIQRLEDEASARVSELVSQFASDIMAMGDSADERYGEIMALACEPEWRTVRYPETIEGHTAGDLWERHLYTDPSGHFAESFNEWEKALLQAELGDPHVLFWLRNPPRKPWSLCVPYLDDSDWHAGMYPDVLIVREDAGALKADLLDPHSVRLADCASRARGLARYAARNFPHFGRIQMIMLDGGTLRRLDLTKESVRNALREVQTAAQVLTLFREAR
ncbi:MAG: DEAD/DEAH box helicase family protein [Armatimonadetes bacterium]|nr:DEAD/DEAH box helicase family protein [Armatimonadota bacterium]